MLWFIYGYKNRASNLNISSKSKISQSAGSGNVWVPTQGSLAIEPPNEV